MAVFVVLYTYDPERHDTRMAERPAHRAFLADLLADGTLLAAGAWADDGAPGGLLVARADTAEAAAAAFDPDPYRRAGVLSGREIREWAQLLGPWAKPPEPAAR